MKNINDDLFEKVEAISGSKSEYRGHCILLFEKDNAMSDDCGRRDETNQHHEGHDRLDVVTQDICLCLITMIFLLS